MHTNDYLDIRKIILEKIKSKGGWINCHAHIDRAYTLTSDNFQYSDAPYQQKWAIVDELKRISTVAQIYGRMARAVENMISQNVAGLATFIDVDHIVEDKVIRAAQKVRDDYSNDITIKYINHVKMGVLEPEARKWFELGAEFADIVGSMLNTDPGQNPKHLDVVMETAKKLNKIIHVHVDQSNTASEKETELLADKTIEHNMQGKVVAIHGISLAAHPKDYRQMVYKKMEKAGLMAVCCPSAWIDSARSEEVMPKHNSITPVDELIPAIEVGIGTDNFADITVPFTSGDMWEELKLLMIACRMRDLDIIVDVATVNGRKIIGIK